MTVSSGREVDAGMTGWSSGGKNLAFNGAVVMSRGSSDVGCGTYTSPWSKKTPTYCVAGTLANDSERCQVPDRSGHGTYTEVVVSAS